MSPVGTRKVEQLEPGCSIPTCTPYFSGLSLVRLQVPLSESRSLPSFFELRHPISKTHFFYYSAFLLGRGGMSQGDPEPIHLRLLPAAPFKGSRRTPRALVPDGKSPPYLRYSLSSHHLSKHRAGSRPLITGFPLP